MLPLGPLALALPVEFGAARCFARAIAAAFLPCVELAFARALRRGCLSGLALRCLQARAEELTLKYRHVGMPLQVVDKKPTRTGPQYESCRTNPHACEETFACSSPGARRVKFRCVLLATGRATRPQTEAMATGMSKSKTTGMR